MKEPTMKRALLTPIAAALLALAGAPASAQDSVTVSPPIAIGSFATTSASLVPVTGIVSGSPESVTFSGQALVQSVLVRDPDFGHPTLRLTIDLTTVSGVGAGTKAKYVIPGREVVQRGLAQAQLVVVPFAFTRSGSTSVAPRTGVLSLEFDVDLETGELNQATGEVSAPNF
jgi:hypothetical protein